MKVICAGAGATGLYLAYRIQKRMTDCTFTIYEKNNEIGGTWLESMPLVYQSIRHLTLAMTVQSTPLALPILMARQIGILDALAMYHLTSIHTRSDQSVLEIQDVTLS
jgi:cation diffusion facilitator CzcD-associated flavoprotein CzcO